MQTAPHTDFDSDAVLHMSRTQCINHVNVFFSITALMIGCKMTFHAWKENSQKHDDRWPRSRSEIPSEILNCNILNLDSSKRSTLFWNSCCVFAFQYDRDFLEHKASKNRFDRTTWPALAGKLFQALRWFASFFFLHCFLAFWAEERLLFADLGVRHVNNCMLIRWPNLNFLQWIIFGRIKFGVWINSAGINYLGRPNRWIWFGSAEVRRLNRA